MHCLRFSDDNTNTPQHDKNDHVPFVWFPASTLIQRRIGEELTLVFLPPHPLIKHWLSILRDELTPPSIFKNALAELGRFLIYEAARDWLLTIKGEVQTPHGVADVDFIDVQEPVMVIPMLREGLVLVEHVASVLPSTQTYHIGFGQDQVTLKPTLYLNKLPDEFPNGVRVLIADASLATGETLISTIELLKQRNVNHRLIRVICAAVTPPALDQLSNKFPGLRIYAATVDEAVTERGDIVPGIGDAGDRSYGT